MASIRSQRKDTKRAQRGLWWWARWGLLLVSLTTGSALCFAVWSNYQSVVRISQKLSHGEGYALLNRLKRRIAQHKGKPDPAMLDALRKENKDSGLSYIGIYRPGGKEIAVSGKPRGITSFPLRRGDTLKESSQWGKYLRMMSIGILQRRRNRRRRNRRRRRRPRRHTKHPTGKAPPPWYNRPNRWRGRWRPGMGGDEDRWRRRRWWRRVRRSRLRRLLQRYRRVQVLIIEFRPQAAMLTQQEAQRNLYFGGIAAFALLLVTGFFWFVLHRMSSLEQQRQEEQQLALLGEMSAVMAHEIRNPLTSLKGHAQLLQESLDEGSKQHSKAGRVVDEAIRLEHLTSQLLDFVRQGDLRVQTLHPAAWCRELISGHTQWEHKQIDVREQSLPGAPERYSFDPTRMTQVVENIIQNAIQASPDEAPIEIDVFREKTHLTISIRDRGPGIPPGQEESLFTPFFTTKMKGTGLGLAVAKRLIELHNGTIEATNHPRGGAVFTIQLPA